MAPAVLGIDTSGPWCSAALVRGSETFVRRAEVGNAHSSHLLSMIEAVLADAAIGLAACDAIAFSAGPGSFTGLRVACAAAQGLGFGASVRVAPVGTLAAIARSAAFEVRDARSLVVAHDARMGEVYWSTAVVDDGVLGVVEPARLGTPDQMRRALRSMHDDGPFDLGCGNAWAAYGAALAGIADRVVARDGADAIDVAHLGLLAFDRGQLVAPELASPIYVRNEVALTTIERAARAAARAGADVATAALQ